MESNPDKIPVKTADFWQPLPDRFVICMLCPHACRIGPGRAGLCRARKNADGRLLADSYAKVTSIALDPVEKKPLYRFYPGSTILSVGSFGCNFRCGFCQNWTIAQQQAPYRVIMPDEMVQMAVERIPQGNIGLAFTYNEPLVGYEYVFDCARLVRQKQMKNVLVTNGSINPEPLERLLPLIDAMNIDLKAWQPEFYRTVCQGKQKPVLDTIVRSAAACHVEITTLLIPGLNDQPEAIGELASWLAQINPDIPLHLTRHHPDYLMTDGEPISRQHMDMLAAIARRWLKTVFMGNMPI